MTNHLKGSAFFALVLGAAISCSSPKEAPKPLLFDASHSDPAAVELADSVENSAGGRQAWDDTKYISWTSSSGRNIFWDKQHGKVRIESSSDNTIYLLNVLDSTARVKLQDKESTGREEGLIALSIFNEDSQELLLPFLLKQYGSKLVYMGEDSLSDGTIVNILNFSKGGDSLSTISIKVGVSDKLIKHVAKGQLADSITSVASWDNYKNYNSLFLSANRSNGVGPTNVKLDPIADDRFENF
jgi:hypothetical protein